MKLTKKRVNEIFCKISKTPLNFKFLSTGAHNENYLVQTKEKSFILRIESNNQFKNLKNEYKILKSLNGKYGAPKVFLFDNKHKIIKKDYNKLLHLPY